MLDLADVPSNDGDELPFGELSLGSLPAPCWTAGDVRAMLVETFLALPTSPIYSRAGGRVAAIRQHIPDATYDWIGFLNEVIPERDVRLSVLIWAKSEAAREIKRRKLLMEIPRASIAEACREHGWHRKTFERRVKAALATLAGERSRRDAAGL